MITTGILAIIVAYLLGSIPFAYIFARLVKGADIRQVGSGNVGAMNTVREIGVIAGLAVLLLDIAKGSLAVLIAQWLGVSFVFLFLVGFAAVVGHSWPVFLGFKGGRGAATALGVLFVLAPGEFAISFAIMVVIVLATRNSGLGIGVGLVLLPIIIWGFGGERSLIIYSLSLSLFLGLRNILAIKRELMAVRNVKDFIFGKQSGQRKR